MKRHFRIAVWVAAFVILVNILMLWWFGYDAAPTKGLMWIDFVGIPVIYIIVHVLPPPMGESEIGGWDYFMMGAWVVSSALIWGIIASFVRWAAGKSSTR